MNRSAASTVSLALLASFFAAFEDARASVVDVTPTGPNDFSALQNAIIAASDGDILVVHGGDFTPISIASKGLSLVADPASPRPQVVSVEILDLAANQHVEIRGFDFRPIFLVAQRVESCLGSVLFEDCTMKGYPGGGQLGGSWPGVTPLFVNQSQSVSIVRCTLVGGAGDPGCANCGIGSHPPSAGGPGLAISDSTVAMYESSLLGGNGPPNGLPYGSGHGASASGNSSLLVSGSSLAGGAGGAGGNGLALATASQSVFVIDSAFTGGTGTVSSGAPISNPGSIVWTWPATHRALRLTSPVQQLAPIAIDVVGVQGDVVLLFVSPASATLPVPGLQGWLAAALPIGGPIFLATITSPSGLASFVVPAPALPPTLDGIESVVDPVFVNGAIGVGGAPSLLVLRQ